ncbi:MAG: BLUF domain-containing protein [Phycisphaeraceae bacterium]|nr:BLUF domain-containing protein [Phycisphaerales bacterium]MCB9859243.1 BLUF domain-containing protein [Phycisphaeraceae bacterium]
MNEAQSQLHMMAYSSKRQSSLSDSEIIDGIVLPAMRKNRILDVTGCLWFNDTYFAQLLEGAADVLHTLMHRICADHRHTNVEVLIDQPLPIRHFERFSMQVVPVKGRFDIKKLLISAEAGSEIPQKTEESAPHRTLFGTFTRLFWF